MLIFIFLISSLSEAIVLLKTFLYSLFKLAFLFLFLLFVNLYEDLLYIFLISKFLYFSCSSSVEINYTYGKLEVLPYVTGTGNLSKKTVEPDEKEYINKVRR